MRSLVLLLSACCGLSLATTRILHSFETGSGTYNVGEDVLLSCIIETEEALALGYELDWYKRQDGQFYLLGSGKNVLQPPFANNPAKYNVDYNSDRKTKIANLTLSIKGVESVDIGDYKCVVGYKNEEKTESDILQLNTNPELVSNLKLVTDALSEGSVMLFNIENSITCVASAATLSKELKMSIKLADGRDISASFIPNATVTWTGEEGLRIPITRHSLYNKWMPSVPGDGAVSCYYEDGERQLAVQTFTYRRDETASISCNTNYKVPVQVGDLDVYITCQIHDYSDISNLAAKWTFLYENEEVHLFTGETKHLRSANSVGDKYTLFMPRITREMITYGKIFNYDLLLSRKDDKEPVAAHTYGLPTDTTYRITGDGARNYYASTVLLLASLFLLL